MHQTFSSIHRFRILPFGLYTNKQYKIFKSVTIIQLVSGILKSNSDCCRLLVTHYFNGIVSTQSPFVAWWRKLIQCLRNAQLRLTVLYHLTCQKDRDTSNRMKNSLSDVLNKMESFSYNNQKSQTFSKFIYHLF